MMRLLLIAAIACSFAVTGCNKKKNIPLKSDKEKASYIIGQQIGQGIKQQKIEIDVDVIAMSIADVLEGKQSRMTDQEIQETMQRLRQTMMEKQEQEGKANKEKGDKFLEENKKNPGVKVTASGLQYEIQKEGTGQTPTASDSVKVHYRGTLIDGTEFDSSYKRNEPATFPVQGVIKGWTEALLMMKVGQKMKIFVPAELAYGAMGRPSIPANSVLIFEMELLEVIAPSKDAGKASGKPAAPAKKGKK